MMYKLVRTFRKKMNLAMAATPTLLQSADVSYFSRFMLEELSEFMRANERESIVDAADALADLVYVAMGCAHAMGLPFEEIFEAVHHANMQKQIADNEKHVIKPEGWHPPEPAIEKLINTAKGL